MILKDLGHNRDYLEILALQERTVREVAVGSQQETVHLVEHLPVFTRGRKRDKETLLSVRDWQGESIPVIETNRGGDITFHGPGQLVGYPHLDLRQRGRDLHGYLRDLEGTLIGTAAGLGVTAFRRDGLTGVWTDSGKLASIGVGVRHWVTMHGFALNVSTDLSYFELIDPCGIQDCPVTSLSEELGGPVEMAAVKIRVQEALEQVFGPVMARGAGQC